MGSELVRNEAQQYLFAQALRTLPVGQQTLVELHYGNGLDPAALGEIFDLPVTAIRMRLSRARGSIAK